MQKNSVTIIGLGNLLMGDEGVGVHALNEFQRRYILPEWVEVVDGGTAGLDLLPFIEGRDNVLIIDAVMFGREPGYIELIENDAIPVKLSFKGSMHHFALMDVLSILKLAGSYPTEICIVGIQPGSIELGLDLSREMCEKMDALISHITDKLRSWNVPCVLRSPQE